MVELKSACKKMLPQAVQNKLQELKKLELALGHLPVEHWKVHEIKPLEEPDQPQGAKHMEVQTERLFQQICQWLQEASFSEEEIAQAVNHALTPAQGMAYCNAQEVKEVLVRT